MSSRWVIVAAALAAAGCGKKDDAPKPDEPAGGGPELSGLPIPKMKPAAAPTGTPRPQPGLTATVDGAAVAMQQALAVRRADDAIEVTVSSVPLGCDEITGKMRRIHDGEQTFSVLMRPQLRPDGTLAYGIAQASYDAMTVARALGDPKLRGTGAPGEATTLEVDLELEGMAFGERPKHTLVARGAIDALGCTPGERTAQEPPPPAQPGATLTVAGQALPIRAVVIEQDADGSRTIVVSSGGASCNGFAHHDRAAAALTLRYRAGGDEVWQADLMGEWLSGQAATQIFGEARPSATPNVVPDGAATVPLTLAGGAHIGDFDVTVTGAVTAQVCAEQP